MSDSLYSDERPNPSLYDVPPPRPDAPALDLSRLRPRHVLFGVAGVLALIAALAWWLVRDVPDPFGETPWSVQRAVKNAVDRRLKDPVGARYEFSFYEHGTYLCGYVNAKNSYGAYAGAELFFVEAHDTFVTNLHFAADGPEAARACEAYRPRPVHPLGRPEPRRWEPRP